ncbi:MAG TPA: DUF5011 domain-containing protein, partial [Candidatus Nitrosotenuis sp.]
GYFVENTMNGHLYRMSGSIKGSNLQTDLIGSFELVSSTNIYEKEKPPPPPEPEPPQILLMTKQFSNAMIGGYYKFDLKVYYTDKNPFRDYYQLGGEAQNATVSLKITSPTGVILEQFDGYTNSQGYFEDQFIIPKNTQPGQYAVSVNAQMGESMDNNALVLSIVEQPRPDADVETVSGSPIITLIGDDPQTILKDSPYVEANATASDPEDGDLSGAIIIDSSGVDTSTVGTYVVTYTVTDSDGNTANKTRTVTVFTNIVDSDFNDNLDVDSGETVFVTNGAEVNGNIIIDDGTLILEDGCMVNGNVYSENGGTINVTNCTITGSVKTKNSQSVSIEDSTINGDIVSENDETLYITDTTIGGNVDVKDNQFVSITGNTINGNLNIQNTAGSCTNTGNNVNGDIDGCP